MSLFQGLLDQPRTDHRPPLKHPSYQIGQPVQIIDVPKRYTIPNRTAMQVTVIPEETTTSNRTAVTTIDVPEELIISNRTTDVDHQY